MKPALWLLILPLLLIGEPLSAAELYRCRVLDSFSVVFGRAIRTPHVEGLAKVFDQTIIDTHTGTVRSSGGNLSTWRIEKRGSSENDFVISNGPSDSIHIRVWTNSRPQWVRISNGFEIFTGDCEVVK